MCVCVRVRACVRACVIFRGHCRLCHVTHETEAAAKRRTKTALVTFKRAVNPIDFNRCFLDWSFTFHGKENKTFFSTLSLYPPATRS